MWHSKVFWIHWGKNALKSVEKKIFWGAWPDFRYWNSFEVLLLQRLFYDWKTTREKNHSTIAINSVAFGQYTSEKWRFFVPKSTWNIIRVVSLKYFLRNIKTLTFQSSPQSNHLTSIFWSSPHLTLKFRISIHLTYPTTKFRSSFHQTDFTLTFQSSLHLSKKHLLKILDQDWHFKIRMHQAYVGFFSGLTRPLSEV